MQRPKLRDNKNKGPFELYPLGQIPTENIVKIGSRMAYFYAYGKEDITGEDWGDIFAYSIDGKHLGKPIGLADVVKGTMAWSAKSVTSKEPHKAKGLRVISGRCSPDYSYGISDPHQDVQRTGDAVLSIWNERINVAKDNYEPLRTAILIRNFAEMEFTLFEHETFRFITNAYEWKVNKNGNLEGFEVDTNKHLFTWQPHGSQFTIISDVPKTAIRFKVKKPKVLDFETTMAQMGFDDNWVTIL